MVAHKLRGPCLDDTLLPMILVFAPALVFRYLCGIPLAGIVPSSERSQWHIVGIDRGFFVRHRPKPW